VVGWPGWERRTQVVEVPRPQQAWARCQFRLRCGVSTPTTCAEISSCVCCAVVCLDLPCVQCAREKSGVFLPKEQYDEYMLRIQSQNGSLTELEALLGAKDVSKAIPPTAMLRLSHIVIPWCCPHIVSCYPVLHPLTLCPTPLLPSLHLPPMVLADGADCPAQAGGRCQAELGGEQCAPVSACGACMAPTGVEWQGHALHLFACGPWAKGWRVDGRQGCQHMQRVSILTIPVGTAACVG